jgi:hypothetical protein
MLLSRITVLEFSALLQHSIALYCVLPQTLQNTDGVIKNGQSRETDSIGYTSRRQTKQKQNTTCVGHHYPQQNTTSIRRELFYKQVEVKLKRTSKTEIVTDITIRNFDLQNDITKKPQQIQISNPDTTKKTEGGMSSSSIFLWNAFLPIRLIHCLKLALEFIVTIKILCIHTILNAEI